MAKKLLIQTYEECDRKLLELAKVKTFIAKKEAEMNAKIQTVKDKFEQDTSDARAQQQLIESDINQFLLVNKNDFEKQRSKTLNFGTVGFRNHPPKVTQLSRKYSISTSIELLKKIFTGQYLRNKEEINKDEILTDYAQKKLTDEQLAAVGLKIDNDETSYVEVAWDKLEQTEEAA